MLVSFVLSLVPEALARDVVAGHVEAVDSGDRCVVRNLDELLAFLRAACQPPASVVEEQ